MSASNATRNLLFWKSSTLLGFEWWLSHCFPQGLTDSNVNSTHSLCIFLSTYYISWNLFTFLSPDPIFRFKLLIPKYHSYFKAALSFYFFTVVFSFENIQSLCPGAYRSGRHYFLPEFSFSSYSWIIFRWLHILYFQGVFFLVVTRAAFTSWW